MIDYLTYEDYSVYDPQLKPSQQRNAGGMQSKTYRVRLALEEFFPGSKVVSCVEDITEKVVLIEPLWYIMNRANEYHESGTTQKTESDLEQLYSMPIKRIIYGSEFGPLRMSREEQAAFFGNGDIVTYNCEFLKNLFSYIDIPTRHLLTDPMDVSFVPGTLPRTKQVVSMGSISWIKNTMQIIEVYKRLEGLIDRVYIGNGRLWGVADDRSDELEEALFANCEKVIPNAAMSDSIAELQQSKIGYWCAWHDTFSSCAHEMIACGVQVVAAPHGHAKELPIIIESEVERQVEKILEVAEIEDEAYNQLSSELADWTANTVSNEVFASQLREIIREIL